MKTAAPDTPRRWRRLQRWAFLVTGSLLLLSIALMAAFCVGSPSYYSEKYQPSIVLAAPAALPGEIRPQHQTEPHTCGFHSLSSIYLAYGLDPEALNLRFRLGIDRPATNLDNTTSGMLHPDMLRVLTQDGFHAKCVDPRDRDAKKLLFRHLDSGHPALALTRPSGLHWLVLCRREAEEVVVCDSLSDEPYRREAESYLASSVYSLILVRPAGESEYVTLSDVHALGLVEMAKVWERQ